MKKELPHLPTKSLKTNSTDLDSYASLQFTDALLRVNFFNMKVAELNARIKMHVDAGHYIEAFMLKSAYMESVVEGLFLSFWAVEHGFGPGNEFNVALDRDADLRKTYEGLLKVDLKDKIKSLQGKKFIPGAGGILLTVKDTSLSRLQNWRDRRNKIFHNFAELMLKEILESECQREHLFLEKIAHEYWFVAMENYLAITQRSMPSK